MPGGAELGLGISSMGSISSSPLHWPASRSSARLGYRTRGDRPDARDWLRVQNFAHPDAPRANAQLLDKAAAETLMGELIKTLREELQSLSPRSL